MITALPSPPSTNDPANFEAKSDALLAALPLFVTEANATAVAMNLNSTTDTSASSVAIGTGAKSLTVSAGKSFQPGMWLVIADTAAPSTNQMIGTITSYSTSTGALVMNVTAILGGGTKTAWVISQSSSGGAIAGPLAMSGITGAASTDLATATVAGLVELATTAEALAGTDTARAVTPAGLATTRRLAQRQRTNVTAVITGTATTIPVDTSTPQITEGAEMMTVSITPTVIGSTIVVSASACFGISAAGEYCTMALFRDAVANALDARAVYQGTALSAPAIQVTNYTEILTSSLTPITFRIRAGSSAGATPYMNGSNTGTPTFSGVSNSFIIAEEYLP